MIAAISTIYCLQKISTQELIIARRVPMSPARLYWGHPASNSTPRLSRPQAVTRASVSATMTTVPKSTGG